MCDGCKKALADGFDPYTDEAGNVTGSFPVTSPWNTGCACEWDVEEISP
jgi:hypothetical protein